MMSKAGQKIESIFKNVPWTGGSEIHRSLASGGTVPFNSDQHNELMFMLTKHKIAESIWEHLQQFFGEAEFLMSKDEFTHLVMVDFSRHMRGLGDLDSDQKLQNPVTGSRFHRIALSGDLVCGIRFWCDPASGITYIGYRFRVEALDEDEDRVRVRMRETLDAVEECMEELNELIMDIKEPIHESEIAELTSKMAMEVQFNDY